MYIFHVVEHFSEDRLVDIPCSQIRYANNRRLTKLSGCYQRHHANFQLQGRLAETKEDDMTRKVILKAAILSAALFSTPAFASTAPSQTKAAPALERSQDDATQLSRRGRGRDHGPNHAMKGKFTGLEFARRGADDPAGHTRQGRGRDDGQNHG